MTLLETIRALDAPYRVHLPWNDFVDFCREAKMKVPTGPYAFYVGNKSVEHIGPMQFSVPDDSEIDALLAGVGR